MGNGETPAVDEQKDTKVEDKKDEGSSTESADKKKDDKTSDDKEKKDASPDAKKLAAEKLKEQESLVKWYINNKLLSLGAEALKNPQLAEKAGMTWLVLLGAKDTIVSLVLGRDDEASWLKMFLAKQAWFDLVEVAKSIQIEIAEKDPTFSVAALKKEVEQNEKTQVTTATTPTSEAHSHSHEDTDEDETEDISQVEKFDKKAVPIGLPLAGLTKDSRFGDGPGEHPGHTSRYHAWLDIPAKKGTPVLAPAEGKVILVANQVDGAGKYIEIDHGDYITRFFHLSERGVKVWDVIKRGDEIGKVGSTGHSSGPHLHYEIRNEKEITNTAKKSSSRYKVEDPMTFMDFDNDGQVLAFNTKEKEWPLANAA